jgi:hypothetical protein
MDISFVIASYAFAKNRSTKQNVHAEMDYYKTISQDDYSQKQITIVAIFIIVIAALLFVVFTQPSFIYSLLPYSFVLIMFLVIVIMLIALAQSNSINSSNRIAQIDTQTEHIRYLGEKIHFSANEIKISSPNAESNHTFFYTTISQFKLQFNGYGEVYSDSYLKWTSKGEVYHYPLVIDSFYAKEQLIKVLKHLYEKGISIQEWDKNGEETYLLSPVAKPKNIIIDEKVQRLIDEIGEKEK